ncbi:MAG: hypothetical protein OQK09_01645 [Colwellia sp.]|nr:hypothetical protein [Colwellia sp.]MCW8865558.1 hypothetical protein [Colwellia sp.]MCW9080191.1 hypothetical protein [Colwellia sp.]
MDIFTTQLTRVVPVPIKPANLKVKALLKEAGTGKLKEDLDHLENHEYYFADNEQNSKKQNEQEKQLAAEQAEAASTDKPKTDNADEVFTDKNGVKHLDLYV